MTKHKNWYGDTHAEQLEQGETFVSAMEAQGAGLGMSAAFRAAFSALVSQLRTLFTRIGDKTATEDEKKTFRLKLRKMITLMRECRTKYIDPAGLDTLKWAAWGLKPRKEHRTKAAHISGSLKVAHQYIRGVSGQVILTFTPVGGEVWGMEAYCNAFELYFGEYTEGDFIPTTIAGITGLAGHAIVKTGRPVMNWEAYRGKLLMVFVRMLNGHPVPGPFNDPPDLVRVT
jgi:hypothetical protein